MPDTVFQTVSFQLGTLVANIESGQIGLPDIQRPFVWEAAKVRDLFDSMYRGFPVGHLLFWSSGVEKGTRQIGTDQKQIVPEHLIVDGQQRLTSLYAVMKQQPVVTREFQPMRIRIAFRPRDATFAVLDAAVERDPAFLPDIGEIWARSPFTVITEFLKRLDASGTKTADDDDLVPDGLNRLYGLQSYPFTALVLGAEVDEEQVAEVFVRINSKGKTLNQADFILTLMSVHWDAGRRALEQWCREARTPGDPAATAFFTPEPADLLRVAIALGFQRGRLEGAYTLLRGRDAKTDRLSTAARDAQFAVLADAQAKVLDKSVWKDFLQCLLRAGYRSSSMISSDNAVLFAYAFYLIGKHRYGVRPKPLRDVIARWFFMVALTGRYSSSPESTLDQDMQSLPEAADADSFVARLDEMIDQRLTNDFWQITLPGYLATSTARSGALFGYYASLCLLDAPVLFSKMRCAELLDPAYSAGSSKTHRHHLFPRKFLEQRGIVDLKQVNQIANMALIEWHDNLAISATDPEVYWPAYLEAMRHPPAGAARFTEAEIDSMLRAHALPEDWPGTPYGDFLEERRKGLARVTREAFERLRSGRDDEPEPIWPPSSGAIELLLSDGETSKVEMKSTLRVPTDGRETPPKVLEKIAARTVAGFMNHHGGILVIGANDDGAALGLDRDIQSLSRKDLDGFQQKLVEVLARLLGSDVAAAVDIHLAKVGVDGRDIALVRCPSYLRPVYLKDGGEPEFHVRAGNTTRLLDVQEATTYVIQHWRGSAVRS